MRGEEKSRREMRRREEECKRVIEALWLESVVY